MVGHVNITRDLYRQTKARWINSGLLFANPVTGLEPVYAESKSADLPLIDTGEWLARYF